MKVFQGPPPILAASIFVVLFCTGLYFVTSFNGLPYFPGPWVPASQIETYFELRSNEVLLCAFFQFGSAIALGVFTTGITGWLRYAGIHATGVDIARFGGWMTAFAVALSAQLQWTMAQAAVVRQPSVIDGFYYAAFAIGGVGFSVPFGLLVAGIAVTCAFANLLPRWFVIVGVIIAVIGELSWLEMVWPQLLALIPLTRFPGFAWIIAAAWMLAKKRPYSFPTATPVTPLP